MRQMLLFDGRQSRITLSLGRMWFPTDDAESETGTLDQLVQVLLANATAHNFSCAQTPEAFPASGDVAAAAAASAAAAAAPTAAEKPKKTGLSRWLPSFGRSSSSDSARKDSATAVQLPVAPTPVQPPAWCVWPLLTYSRFTDETGLFDALTRAMGDSAKRAKGALRLLELWLVLVPDCHRVAQTPDAQRLWFARCEQLLDAAATTAVAESVTANLSSLDARVSALRRDLDIVRARDYATPPPLPPPPLDARTTGLCAGLVGGGFSRARPSRLSLSVSLVSSLGHLLGA